MTIDARFLAKMGVREDRAEIYGGQFTEVLPIYHIDTPLREAHFVAQILHESGMCRFTRENLNYSADALYRVFRKYFPTKTLAQEYEYQPERIGSRVYADRMGNGNETSGDGYHYRGRGLIQLTGKDNYRAFSRWAGADVVDDPARVADEFPVSSAVFFWDTRNINELADRDSIRQVTRKINGGYNGLPHRTELLDGAKQLLGDNGQLADLADDRFYRVTASRLNLRSSPKIASHNKIGSLSRNARVEKISNRGRANGWTNVRTARGKEGYLASRYLRLL